jgi:serine/threonine protein kinase
MPLLPRVKLAKDEKHSRFVAVKMLQDGFSELELNLLFNEVRALMRLTDADNKYTQKVLDLNFYGEVRTHKSGTTKTAYFVMPIEEHGEFYTVIERTQNMPESVAKVLFRGLVDGNLVLPQRSSFFTCVTSRTETSKPRTCC